MSFCPYCKEIVGSNVTECPSCGMSWSSEQPPEEQPIQERKLPKITAEEPLPPPEQPPAQQPVQQPPQPVPPPEQQPPQYQPPVQQYQDPQYYQQPIPPTPTHMHPPQQYGRPYAPPVQKRGGGGMAMAIVGGIMGIIAAFMLFYISSPMTSTFMDIGDLLNINDSYIYAWLIPVFGILAMLFAIIAFAAQNKAMGTLAGVFGILLLIIPLVLAFHISVNDDISVVDVFYVSQSFMGVSVTMIYLGGILAIIGGILAIVGGFGMAKKLVRVRQPAQPHYYR